MLATCASRTLANRAMTQMNVLVTGGAGYIGSHACAVFAHNGANVTVYDNFSSSCRDVVNRVSSVVGRPLRVVEGDVLDAKLLAGVLREGAYDAVVHFAGLKSISESLTNPLAYYQTNVTGTLNLLAAMKASSTRIMVFSSSASVYGDPASCPVREDAAMAPTNPYADSKRIVENLLVGLRASDSAWRFAALRYFNPVGAHASGSFGESVSQLTSNLLPAAIEVALRRRPELLVYGDDYSTPDGTGVRDYVHVMDLAEGHLSALHYLIGTTAPDMLILNLGNGHGVSVLQMVAALERASGVSIPIRIVSRRPGDVAACYANVERAAAMLGWSATRSVDEMCADAWRWATRDTVLNCTQVS